MGKKVRVVVLGGGHAHRTHLIRSGLTHRLQKHNRRETMGIQHEVSMARRRLAGSAFRAAFVAAAAFFLLAGEVLPLCGQEVRLSVAANDSATGEPIPFFFVYVDERCLGQADSTGTLTVRVVPPLRCVTVRVAAQGYGGASERICLRPGERERRVLLSLSARPIQMASLTVEETRPLLLQVGPAKYTVRGGGLDHAPLWPGDAVRFAQTVPMVGFRSDFSSSFYAAGSDFYQSLVLWSGTPALNCAHLGGIVSSLVALPGDSIVTNALVAPLEAPPVLGGAVEVWPKPGTGPTLDINPLSGMVGYSSSGRRFAGSAHARVAHFATVGSAAGLKLPYNFVDGGAWCRTQLGSGLSAEASLFSAADVLNVETGGWKEKPPVSWKILWGNTLARAALDCRVSASAETEVAFSYSVFRMGGSGPDDTVKSSMSIWGAEQRLSCSSSSTRWSASLAYRRYRTLHRWNFTSRDLWDMVGNPARMLFDFAPVRFRSQSHLSELTPSLQLEARHGNVEAAVAAQIHLLDGHWRFPLSTARVSLCWKCRMLVATFSAGRNVQLYFSRKQHLSEELLEPASAFFLCTNPRQALSAFYAAGTLTGWWRNASFGAHFFAKKLQNVPLTDFLRRIQVVGSGRAYGAGVWLDFSSHRVRAAGAVDLARAFLHHTAWYPAHYDRPLQGKLSAEWHRWPRLRVQAFATACSGLPYTEMDRRYLALEDLSEEPPAFDQIFPSGPDETTSWRPAWSDLFGARTPAYFRLDAGLEYAIRRAAGAEWVFYIKVFNVTNRSNPLAYFWNMEVAKAERKPIWGLPRLPVIGIRYRPTTSRKSR